MTHESIMAMVQEDAGRDFGFGKGLATHGYSCCGKPKGCTNMNLGCAHLDHPYKIWVRDHSPEDLNE